ncbi:Vps52 / Sac2 family domain containing protein [Rhypophila sp. PSN 637]
MWLNQLAGQHSASVSSSQASSRPISPLPRRTSSHRAPGPYLTSQRAANSPGVSSISLVSNNSSTSLLSSAKRPNGSALKRSATAQDAPDPDELLARILGPAPKTSDAGEKTPAQITEELVDLDFDFGGLGLRELAREDGQAFHGDKLKYKPQTIDDYERDKTRFQDLHRQIRACDEILSSVETNLTSFRNDLAAVSADIETLQSRSTALNVRLENRKAVEKGLGPVVEELSVPPLVVSKIPEGHIDEAWVKMLAEVDRRATAHKKNSSQAHTKALADIGPLLEKLVLKAIERIRDFLVAQVKALRSPHINAQIIQQQNFMKFKDLFSFLQKHQPVLAGEICQAYMNTMRWYYLNQFTRYEKALEKIKLHVLDKSDVLGHEDASRRATVLASSKLVGSPHDAFNLGRRIDILRTNNQAALSSYLAEEDQSTHYLEVPFRNFNLALIDNATAEYTFLAAFFSPALSFSVISRHFNYIFEPTFALGQALTKQLVTDTYDGLGLLLCVRLNQHFAFELQRRRVPAVENYINGTAMVLWPRLQNVMDAHCESLKALANRGAPSSSSKNPVSPAPHVVTQRFGQLLHGILTLSIEAGDDEPVVASLRRLRNEFESFVTKFSAASFGSGADKRKRERFLYNNYSLILTIISDVSGKLAVEQQDHFEKLKAAFQEAG